MKTAALRLLKNPLLDIKQREAEMWRTNLEDKMLISLNGESLWFKNYSVSMSKTAFGISSLIQPACIHGKDAAI